MMDAHGRLVVETNKVNVCVVVDICVFINALGIYLLSVTQCEPVSALKHRCLFPFHTWFILLASGLRAKRQTALVVDFYTLISTYSCCSCTQKRLMKLLFGSQNSRSLNITNIGFLKGIKIGFQKPYGDHGFRQMSR